MLMLPMRDGTGRTTRKDRATQLLICEPLSFAMSFEGQSTSTGSLFYRQYTNILEEIAPTVVGTGATLGVCKF